jgi:hypothetical protein
MRCEAVFVAAKRVGNRYALCRVCAKGARKLHAPSSRIEDTINTALLILGQKRGDNLLKTPSPLWRDVANYRHDLYGRAQEFRAPSPVATI